MEGVKSKKQAIKEIYDKTANIYDRRYRSIQKEKYEIMLESLQLKTPILDLGCGTGLLQKYLRTIKTNLIGIDISYEMLKHSKELCVQGDVENLPFKDNSFATVLSFTTFQNLDSAEKALTEVARVLQPNGLAVITILLKCAKKLQNVKKHFKIKKIKKCSEDIGLILAPNK
jgi:ubiquinone/menaquinone biosynthesis C-methylase UbiE